MIKNDCSNKRVHYEKWAKGNEVNTALSALVHLRRNIINVKERKHQMSSLLKGLLISRALQYDWSWEESSDICTSIHRLVEN